MEHTYEELKHKKVVELREIAAGLDSEAVKGYTQLNKEHLIDILCDALGIDKHLHKHHAAHLAGKSKIKAQIKALKVRRDQAIESKEKAVVSTIIHDIHKLKRKLRKAAIG